MTSARDVRDARADPASGFVDRQACDDGGRQASAPDEYAQRELYRTYHHYKPGHLDLATRPPC